MPEDFLVTLYTGSRWGAGTKADVFLQLISQNGTSDVHCLWHPQVPSFHQGSTDRFLLTTREGLGDICTLYSLLGRTRFKCHCLPFAWPKDQGGISPALPLKI
uniref:PLAT domain-containing protein n=1 Tax=Anser brachyrhynchus TaxID=132585 RepID=A0A8B9BP63_9AVES